MTKPYFQFLSYKIRLHTIKRSHAQKFLNTVHSLNKNAFQYDAYRPLVAHISQHVLLPGVPGQVPPQGSDTPSLPRPGIPENQTPLPWTRQPPWARHPFRQVPPRPDTPWYQAPPRGRPPGADIPPLTEFLTHATENITLPQTSFAGSNKKASQ